MTDSPDHSSDRPPEPTYRFWGTRRPPKNRSEFWAVAVEPRAASEVSDSKVATLRMYGPIDSWGGYFGISAKDVAGALDSLPDDVEEVRVRINSPGGDAWEGMAILNMLRAHKVRAVAVVDGMAASAASFVAAGCDETVMSPGTQMMIHDASGFCLGQATDMRKVAEALDSCSDSIASIYAEATGDSREEWRAVMVEETWYTADEAVEAGLADRVAVVADPGETATAGEPEAGRLADQFDLSFFNYAGRDHAPAPHKPPSASAVGSVNTSERGPAVAFTDEQLTTMRQDLGLAEDADEATIVAAMSEALTERADPPVSTSASGQPAPAAPPPAAQPAKPTATAAGTMVIDQSAWDEQQTRIQRLEAQDAKRRVEQRDQVIAQAVADGKFKGDRKDHWKRLWDADPEGTRSVIDGLTKGVIPTNELGYAGDDEAEFDEFAHLFAPKGA